MLLVSTLVLRYWIVHNCIMAWIVMCCKAIYDLIGMFADLLFCQLLTIVTWKDFFCCCCCILLEVYIVYDFIFYHVLNVECCTLKMNTTMFPLLLFCQKYPFHVVCLWSFRLGSLSSWLFCMCCPSSVCFIILCLHISSFI